MTEAEWLAAEDPYPLHVFLSKLFNNHERKWRLFAASCCRHVFSYGDGSLGDLLQAFEEFADGLLDEHTFEQIQIAAIQASPRPPEGPAECVWSAIRGEAVPLTRPPAFSSAMYSSDAAAGAVVPQSLSNEATHEEIAQHPEGHRYFEELIYQARLLRDIFGNPFRPVILNPRWQTSSVLNMASTIYDDRAFEWLPILADALMDAGCDSEELLSHCHSAGPHVRGCWAVDLLLDKA